MRPRIAFLESPDRACYGMDTDLFYDPAVRAIAEAKRVCQRCDVRLDCLDYAMANDELGVWGGMSERDRRRMRASTMSMAARSCW